MVKTRENYIGRKFNHLTVIEQTEDYIDSNNKHFAQYLCECDCKLNNPTKVIVRLCNIKSGVTTSCGCVNKEAVRKKFSKPMKDNPTFELYLKDNNHKPYGRCKTYNTNEWFYFSMDDYEILKDYCWSENIHQSGYSNLKARVNGKMKAMTQLFGMSDPDHINRNSLDNRCENLDMNATRNVQNQNKKIYKNNKSGCKGVRFNKQTGKWISNISIDGKQTYVGEYEDKSSAIISRLNSEIKYYPVRAWQKILMKEYGIEYGQ